MTSLLPLKDLNATLNAFEPWAFFQQSWHGTCIPYYFKVISKDPRLLHQAFGNRSITAYTCFIDSKSFFATLVRTMISLMRGKRFINSAYNSSNLRILKDGKEWKANAIFKRQCPFKKNVIKSSNLQCACAKSESHLRSTLYLCLFTIFVKHTAHRF